MREVAPCLMVQMWNKGQLGSGGREETLVPDSKPGFFLCFSLHSFSHDTKWAPLKPPQ